MSNNKALTHFADTAIFNAHQDNLFAATAADQSIITILLSQSVFSDDRITIHKTAKSCEP